MSAPDPATTDPATAGRLTLTEAVGLAERGELRLVTSDVFDTIVTRPMTTPSDLFVMLGRSLCDAGLLPDDVTPLRFEQARRDAEQQARDDIARDRADERATECTIEQIWSRMPRHWVDDVDAMVQRELDLEAATLRPIEPAIAALRAIRAAGVTVVLVSDIYLSATQLTLILTRAGVPADAYDAVIASADRGVGKSAGLLGDVIAERGVHAAEVVHIGDNEYSDLGAAHALGARVVHVEVPHAARHVPRPGRPTRWYSRANGGDGGLAAAVRAATVAAGDSLDPAWQFGAVAVGPTVAGFARWASVTADRLGASSVHCLLREGATIATAMAAVAPDGPPTRLVHASRWVDMRAAVVEGTPHELYAALAKRGPITVEDVQRAFGCDAEVVRELWEGRPAIRLDVLEDMGERLLAHAETRDRILESSAELRARVLRQLRAELDLSSDPIVLCDVGWGASIQLAITRILRSAGIDTHVTGLYMALSPTGEERIALGHDIRSYLPSIVDDEQAAFDSRAVAMLADSIEQVLTPDTGTLVDVDEAGRPVTATDLIEAPPSLTTARAAVLETVRAIAAGGPDDAVWVDDPAFRSALAAELADVLVRPTAPVAAAILEWHHDDVGGANPTPLAGDRVAELIRWSNLRDIEGLRATEAAWLEGLAAVSNPSLATQLAAAQVGLDAGDLVPPSPCGVSRLSAFPVDSDLAEPQVSGRLACHPEGWSVLRLRGAYRPLRAIRFDAGDVATMVQVASFDVTLTPTDGEPISWSFDDLRTNAIRWVDARPISADRYAEHPAGHLLIPIEPGVGGNGGTIDAMIVFRRWELRDGDPALRPDLRRNVEGWLRRARRGVARLRR